MRIKITYKTGTTFMPIANCFLYHFKWTIIRGTKVLKGKQKIRGKFVNRTIAKDEIINWAEVS